jgi:hypothetical protein
MLNRLTLVLALWALLAPGTAGADPITYDFTGTLTEPFNGSKTFSGTLTINGTPPMSPYVPGVEEDGSDVSVSLSAGGQVLNFSNSPQNPLISAMFSASVLPPESEQPKGTPETEFAV